MSCSFPLYGRNYIQHFFILSTQWCLSVCVCVCG